jgi:adenosylcobinamide-GDP ribazoletransferase
MEGSILWSSLGLAFLITIIFSPFWVAIIGFTFCIIQTYGVMAYADKKIGGVTGDILGANEQISEINFLIIFSAIYGSL